MPLPDSVGWGIVVALAIGTIAGAISDARNPDRPGYFEVIMAIPVVLAGKLDELVRRRRLDRWLRTPEGRSAWYRHASRKGAHHGR